MRRLALIAITLTALASGLVPASTWTACLSSGTECAPPVAGGGCAGKDAPGACCCGAGGSCCVERPAAPAPRPDADQEGSAARGISLAIGLLSVEPVRSLASSGAAVLALASPSSDRGARRGFAASPAESRRHLRHAVFLD